MEKLDPITVERHTRQLFDTPPEGLWKSLQLPEGATKQGTATGRKDHPYDMDAVINLKNFNIHHSTCIETKRDATVGLGFESDEPSDKLDDLCESTFQEVISDCNEDYWQTGNSYIEVVRLGDRPIGVHHIAAPLIYKKVYRRGDPFDGPIDYYWEVVGAENTAEQTFARFGKKDDLLEHLADDQLDPDEVSEIIAIPRPSSLSRWYGYADWLAAVSTIELVQCMTQHEFDFFLNRGVPEFLLFALGSGIDPNTWDKVKTSLKSHIGYGNSHKSSAFNFQDPNLKIQLEKLGLGERQQGVFAEYYDTTSMAIVSAHRVPPLLAGIQIPGKLGATNELPNALMAFQTLVIGQAQRRIQGILSNTLGKELGISKEAFEFNKITDELNLEQMDTMARMREPAAGSGRDVSEGLRD